MQQSILKPVTQPKAIFVIKLNEIDRNSFKPGFKIVCTIEQKTTSKPFLIKLLVYGSLFLVG
jgi:hypothetical protein